MELFLDSSAFLYCTMTGVLETEATLRQPARGLCRVGRLISINPIQVFQAQIVGATFSVIVSSAVLISSPELPPLKRSVAANHRAQSASTLHLYPISISHTSQTADDSCHSMRSCPCATPKSAFCTPAPLHWIFCRLPVCSTNTKWSPVICARSPQSPGSDVSVCRVCLILHASLDSSEPPATRLPPKPSAILFVQIS